MGDYSMGVSIVKPLPVYTGIIGLGMTFFRIILAFLCIPLIHNGHSDMIVAFLVGIIVVFDYYDGKLFRNSLFNESVKWRSARRIIDSCADRLSIQLVCIPIFLAHSDFIFPYLVICFKEIITSTVCLKSFFRGYIIYPSNISRISTVLVGLTVISQLLFGGVVTIIISLMLFIGGVLSFHKYTMSVSLYNRGLLQEGKEYERR